MAEIFPDTTRSLLQKSIKEAGVTIDNKPVSPSFKVEEGQEIEVHFIKSTVVLKLEPQKIEFSIIFEDDDLLVVNKPKGLLVHPGAGVRQPTLADGLVYAYPEIKNAIESPEDNLRPGIVHRLCLLYTSPSPRDQRGSRMPSSA